ncbi:hypothetical protein, partial [Shewanella litorisediminis]
THCRQKSAAGSSGYSSMVQVTTPRSHVSNLFAPSLDQQPYSSSFISGDKSGQLHRWNKQDKWSYHKIESSDIFRATSKKSTLKKTQNLSIVAISHLAENKGWLSLDATGSLKYWLNDEIIETIEFGSPRCLALHANNTTLAIGFKRIDIAKNACFILLDINEWIVQASFLIQSMSQPDDKFYNTPMLDDGLPPQVIRQQLNNIILLALSDNDEVVKNNELNEAPGRDSTLCII